MSDTTQHPVIDLKTGRETTGHEWDGIRELNTPLPRWWLWLFYACIVWSVGYMIAYPAWPLVSDYTRGLLGTSARTEVTRDLEAAAAAKAPMVNRIAQASLAEIVASPELSAFARAQGRMVFQNACSGCHGAGGAGAVGYANLNDDDWIWGGKLDDIYQTVKHGIRWTAASETRISQMPAFGRDGILKPDEIAQVVEYTRSLSRLPTLPGVDLAAGQRLYADNCASCHGDEGRGNRDLGAPNLTDPIWLFASTRESIAEGVRNGRGNVMPAWGDRLDEASIKSVTVFVHGLGGGER